MKFRLKYLGAFVFSGFLFSCVPGTKYQSVNDDYKNCKEQNEKLKRKSVDLEADNKDLTLKNNQLNDEVAELIKDTLDLGNKLRIFAYNNKKLKELNKEIEANLEAILNGDANENSKLLSELELNKLKLQQKEEVLRDLEAELNSKRIKLDELQDALILREQRVDELEAILAKQKQAVNSLKAKLKDALAGFENSGLTIENKDGKVYIRLENKLLFSSGSTSVNPEGKKALIKVAKVLQSQDDLNILVEGHTDTDKLISSTTPKNNWELSVLRATAVVETMLDNSSLSADHVTAAGRSYFVPVSKTDKALNRRIEIILQPNLSELYLLIE
jgi:chemotaxis protein MotB